MPNWLPSSCLVTTTSLWSTAISHDMYRQLNRTTEFVEKFRSSPASFLVPRATLSEIPKFVQSNSRLAFWSCDGAPPRLSCGHTCVNVHKWNDRRPRWWLSSQLCFIWAAIPWLVAMCLHRNTLPYTVLEERFPALQNDTELTTGQ